MIGITSFMDKNDACRGLDGWHTAFTAVLADPADTLPFMPQPRTFRDQTITQRLRLRRGGARLRLVLSNEFGREPLVMDAVTAGDASGEARQPVLLGGRGRPPVRSSTGCSASPAAPPSAASSRYPAP
jgi:hypothetical protein